MTTVLSAEEEAQFRRWLAEPGAHTMGRGVAALEVLPRLLATLDVLREPAGAGLREAAQAMLDKWGNHSGLCCTFDGNGKVIVTDESCKCKPGGVERNLRAALAATEPSAES